MLWSPMSEASERWLECAFNGKAIGQPNAYLYFDLKNSNDKAVSLSYRSASAVDEEPRPLDATGFASVDSIFVVSVERVFKIELKRAIAINRRTNTAELVVSSRTPNLTEWSKPIRYQGTCIGVSQIAKATKLINERPIATMTVAGKPTKGQTLTIVGSVKDPDGDRKPSYTWQRSASGTDNWIVIQSATGSSYILSAADVGFYVRAKVSFIDSKGTIESVTTSPTASKVISVQELETKPDNGSKTIPSPDAKSSIQEPTKSPTSDESGPKKQGQN
jgi:hypothetical protein